MDKKERQTDLIYLELGQAAGAAVVRFVIKVLNDLKHASAKISKTKLRLMEHLFENLRRDFRKLDASSAFLHEHTVRRGQNG
jgi:hypothetical protein